MGYVFVFLSSDDKHLVAKYSQPIGTKNIISIPDSYRIQLFEGDKYIVDFFNSYSRNKEYYDSNFGKIVTNWYIRYWNYLERKCC
jgi:hypothetical protein